MRVGSVVAGVVVGVPAVASAATQSFASTGAEQVFTVPAGVYEIDAQLAGGNGANSSYSGGGGAGGAARGRVPVLPGQVLYVEVGGNGSGTSGGWNGGGSGRTFFAYSGGGGGGGTDVRTLPLATALSATDSRVLVAGGGGGGGYGNAGGSAGNAGPDEGGAAGTLTVGALGLGENSTFDGSGGGGGFRGGAESPVFQTGGGGGSSFASPVVSGPVLGVSGSGPVANFWWGSSVLVDTTSAAGRSFAGTLGFVSPGQVVTVTNTGGSPVGVRSITGADAGDFFLAGDTCTSRVLADQRCSVTVRMAPTATGTRTATLTIDGDTPTTVTLTGTASAAAAGPAGANGSNGVNGVPGVAGPAGVAGPVGEPGAAGPGGLAPRAPQDAIAPDALHLAPIASSQGGRFTFTLPESMTVTLTVKDKYGRTTLVGFANGLAGRNTISWNGLLNGRRAPKGIYRVILRPFGQTRAAVTKVTIR